MEADNSPATESIILTLTYEEANGLADLFAVMVGMQPPPDILRFILEVSGTILRALGTNRRFD